MVPLSSWPEYDNNWPYCSEKSKTFVEARIERLNNNGFPIIFFDAFDFSFEPSEKWLNQFFFHRNDCSSATVITKQLYMATECGPQEIVNDSSESDVENENFDQKGDVSPCVADEENSVVEYAIIEGEGPPADGIRFVTSRTGLPFSRWECLLPEQIFESIFQEVMAIVFRFTNKRLMDEGKEPILLGEFYVFHAILLYMATIRVDNEEFYWRKESFFQNTKFCHFSEKMSLERFRYIRSHLRFADYKGNNDKQDRAWKVRPLVNAMKVKFKSIVRDPTQHLSIDEAMGRCYVKRCPISVCMSDKPISKGFKLYCLVDFERKVLMDFNLEDGTVTSENSKDFPYGASGRRVLELVEGLPGEGYIIYTDNYYTSVPLAAALRDRKFHLIGTLRKDRKPVFPCLKMSNSAHPKPSKRCPRGTMRFAYIERLKLYAYSMMDNGVVYFLDTAFGPHDLQTMKRRAKKVRTK